MVEDGINKMTGPNVAELVANVVDVMIKEECDRKCNNSIAGNNAEDSEKDKKE